jgi:hypothetical protein
MGDVSKELIDPDGSVKELSNFKRINVPEGLRPATQTFIDGLNAQKQVISKINPTPTPNPVDIERDLEIIDQVTNALVKAIKTNGESQKDAYRKASTQKEREEILIVSAASTAILSSFMKTINFIFKKVIDFIQKGYRRVKDAVVNIFETIVTSMKNIFLM